ncbi:transcriptional regulator, AsnC family [Phenylobacterium zucineum HLK1]|uniref:Transcriptional regulator, AsnC family n=1 Tax=Phenylobacterium zucineum (strain HLK1) TaxID=450851 RepID=B4RF30_PHEZH|nr:transcriptional regulator, AsnC family [Phenylobacterium zucineum HLK1]
MAHRNFLPFGPSSSPARSYRFRGIAYQNHAPASRFRGKNHAHIRPQKEEKLSEALDAVDAKILDLIQHDAGLSVAEIADRVGLSSSPCWRRIKRLEDAGVIQRRVTILDRDKLGLGFEVYCTVKLSLPTKENLDSFEQAIFKLPEVVQCATVTGAADYELRIVTRDMHAFDDFLREKILSLGLVSNIESRIVIRSVKNTTAAPLGLVSPYVSAQS